MKSVTVTGNSSTGKYSEAAKQGAANEIAKNHNEWVSDFDVMGFFGKANTSIGFGSVGYGILENSIANKYWWLDSKGKYNSTKILAKGANGKYLNGFRGIAGKAMGYKSALRAANGARLLGNSLGAATIVLTGISYANGDISGLEASIDIAMSAVAFCGPIGFGVSAAYFLTKTGYEYFSGNTVFEKPVKYE